MLSICKIQPQKKGAIIKREWWKDWDQDYVPPIEHVIQSYDTAFLKKETADYSAITTWGVIYPTQRLWSKINIARFN
jgi:hypothetical protein